LLVGAADIPPSNPDWRPFLSSSRRATPDENLDLLGVLNEAATTHLDPALHILVVMRPSVQLSENASGLVLNGLLSRCRFYGCPTAWMPLRDSRAPSAGTNTVHTPASPRCRIGLRVDEQRITEVVLVSEISSPGNGAFAPEIAWIAGRGSRASL
jgi:hypothetical protein